MNQTIIEQISKELRIKTTQVVATLNLLEEGSTVPFIARYRKEMTGSLDEDQIREIEKVYQYELNVANRKEEISRLIDEKGMLTDELKTAISEASKLQQLEDIYLPFKEKRKTKATEAIKKGLEPLADYIMSFPETDSLDEEAQKYLNDEVTSSEDAISGAGHIIAERISETAKYREYIRNVYTKTGLLETKTKKGYEAIDEKGRYENYYEFSSTVSKLKSYQILAINRAEKEKVISVKVSVENDKILEYLYQNVISQTTALESYIKTFIDDGLKRLISPAIEREVRSMLTEKADLAAIETFASNLDALILQAPLKNKRVLGVDPAFRTGCKLAVIDQNSKVEKIDVIYPNEPRNDIAGSKAKFDKIFAEFDIQQIVIGNGTASRETESFVSKYVKENNLDINVSIVSEAGASVYSASKIAQAEFPDLAVEERSAVSIARRIIDPMAELVKIDPKSIGVGQYQHDVNQKVLSENLDFVMIKNINKIGVDINTASRELLKYVSGLDSTIAKNIIEHRNEYGAFLNREEILGVKRLGPKAYTQAAGFLKILHGEEVLDETFIHPESYATAYKIIGLLEIDVNELGSQKIIDDLSDINYALLAEDLEVNEILVKDIIDALKKPNQDIREELVVAEFDQSITSIDDLEVGLEVNGQVRNIVEFGAFVDIGLKNDALVHISQISDKFVKNVSDVLKMGDVHTFKIKDVDKDKGRIQLTLIGVAK